MMMKLNNSYFTDGGNSTLSFCQLHKWPAFGISLENLHFLCLFYNLLAGLLLL
jgi:hypothetical protein